MINSENIRKIIHIDMDAFYASIEERENNDLRNKPVIIARPASERGVVSTCNYVARKYGISSGMPTSAALSKCPSAVLIRPRLDFYKQVTGKIFRTFLQFTEQIEPIAFDEAYLDVTGHALPTTKCLAVEIKKAIYDRTGLTSSAGISFTKNLAKIASGYRKPDGLTVIAPAKALEFTDKMPIHKFFGVGPKTLEKLQKMNISYGSDLKMIGKEKLVESLKTHGERLYKQVMCIDDDFVDPFICRKSLSREKTFINDIEFKTELIEKIEKLAKAVSKELVASKKMAQSVSLKIRRHDFTVKRKKINFQTPVNCYFSIRSAAVQCLDNIFSNDDKIRMIGLKCNFDKDSIVVENSIESFLNSIEQE